MKVLKENKYYLDNMWTTNTTYGDDIEVIYFITEQNKTIYIVALGLAMGVGFALGMYVTTQIGEWINKQIKKK